jgi:F-type H+-transporting ATPase subunit epsilon
MNALLHLTIATPSRVLFDSTEVAALRAEDATGSFGILPGHAAFLTVLAPSVLRWHAADGIEIFCAVKEGVLRVSGGHEVSIACREGVMGTNGMSLEVLEAQVDAARAAQIDAVRRARVDETRLHAQAVRRLLRYLRPSARPVDGVGP